MIPAPQYEFSGLQEKVLHKARILEYITLAHLMSAVVVMYLVMGNSQAMKSAWLEDMLSLIPPVMFLIGARYSWCAPNLHYPYGFHRIVSIGFLVAAVALLLVGGYVVWDALGTFVKAEHPTIGLKNVFGHDVWLGWVMVTALLYASIPPVILGRLKLRPAKILNDAVLYTDAKMNKADWMTGFAAAFGVLGIGMGWWWADAAAALIIGVDVLYDGCKQTYNAVTSLMDRAPKTLDGQYESLPAKIVDVLEALPWVADAEVRLSEQGHIMHGEGFVRLAEVPQDIAAALHEASEQAQRLDWRLRDFVITIRHFRDE